METIPKVDCREIGFFRKTHGVHGKLVLDFETQFENSVEDANRFFVELDGLLVPFFIEGNGVRFTTSKSAIISLEWVDTENYAKRLAGKSVFLYNNEIIDEPEEFTELMLENFLLIDQHIGEVGIIDEVNDYSGNIVFTVKYKNKDILIPFNEELLHSIDEENKTITLNLPDGLI